MQFKLLTIKLQSLPQLFHSATLDEVIKTWLKLFLLRALRSKFTTSSANLW